MRPLLCVEDTPDTRLILKATLGAYPLQFASTMKEAVECLNSEQYSLVLMDIELPDGNGLEIFASFAEKLKGVPFIFLTGRLDYAAKAAAFSLGAEDFVVKPFDPRDLKLRVEAKLRKVQSAAPGAQDIRVGDLQCLLEEQKLVKQSTGETIELTGREFRMFYLLAKNPNKVFTRAEILERIWGESVSVTDRAVDVHISNLRKKLSGSSVTVEAIVGSGYRLQIEPAVTI